MNAKEKKIVENKIDEITWALAATFSDAVFEAADQLAEIIEDVEIPVADKLALVKKHIHPRLLLYPDQDRNLIDTLEASIED